MQLKQLCEFRLWYTTPFFMAQPFGTQEGEGWGAGEGKVSGEITGSAQWANHPRRRSDATMLPDAAGVISTDDGATILFALQGRTPTTGEQSGQQLMRVTFSTGDERYAWLNLCFAVCEGLVDLSAEPYQMVLRVYSLVHELDLSEVTGGG